MHPKRSRSIRERQEEIKEKVRVRAASRLGVEAGRSGEEMLGERQGGGVDAVWKREERKKGRRGGFWCFASS